MLGAVIWMCAKGRPELLEASLNIQVEVLDEELGFEKKVSGELLEDYKNEKRKRIKVEEEVEEYKKKAEEEKQDLEKEIRLLKEQFSLKEGKEEEEKKAEEEKQALEGERRLPKEQFSKKEVKEEEKKLTPPVIIKKALSNSKLPPKSSSNIKTHLPKK